MRQLDGAFPGDTRAVDSCTQDHITIDTRERYGRGFRWKLGVNTTPCIQSRKGRRCVFCGFLNQRNPIPPSEVGQVFNHVLRRNDLRDILRLELYVSGSFFDDQEVSLNSRLGIIESIKGTNIKEVVLESRPEFITDEILEPLTDVIDPKRVTIAIGVETADDNMRSRLSKDFSMEDLSRSIGRIARAGMNFQAYLLLKPPTINDDKQAVIDVIHSSDTIVSLAKEMNCPLTLAIQPFFLARNSLVAQHQLQKDAIGPPWLYTIAITLKLLDIRRARDASGYRIFLGNEIDNVDIALAPSNYTGNGDVCLCSESMRKHLREVNISEQKLRKSVNIVLGSRCYCRKIWQEAIGLGLNDLPIRGQLA